MLTMARFYLVALPWWVGLLMWLGGCVFVGLLVVVVYLLTHFKKR
jgi:hypothetical protein